MMRRLTLRQESFPIRGSFRISRGAKSVADVVVVEIEQEGVIGCGECVPYPRYGETTERVMVTLEALRMAIESGLDRTDLGKLIPAGAARNAVDCALWHLEAKLTGRPVWQLANLAAPEPVTTAYTLSVDTPDAMAAAARAVALNHPLLKLKLTGNGDLERVRAVRAAVPAARLIVDANEAWTLSQLRAFAFPLAALAVELIEQPLPAGADDELAGFNSPVPLGADESCHGLESLPHLKGRYAVINIKLDKTGGLTEALCLKRAATAAGFGIMVGCMVATSLAMAPALLVAQGVSLVDLDGPLLLARDRHPGLTYQGARVFPAPEALWG